MPMHATRRAIDCIDPWSYNRLAEGNTALGMSSTAPASNDATQQNASPSSNQSIFDQIKSEKEKDGSLVSFIGSVIRILFGTSIVSLLMAVSLVILIAMIAIGAVYFDNCPAQNLIPIYLIIMGAASIVKTLINLKGRAQRSRLPSEEQADFKPNKVERIISLLIGVFIFGFFIAGNVWICGIFRPNTTDNSATDYCHPTLYYFAFWWNNVCYIIGIVCFFCCCCYGCLARRYATTKGAAGANSENRDVP
ncbi:transmembrane protein 272-like [Strongylocentrotus purpuratus]|uniref:Uncharacterized protein n=1 Tax=Strongylocentrotus purpuratus TaxID=7668 RepID=A0A7M7PSY8_STRPU|nr:transmembrane protein 272-like [Strongylocentrotus purpuratus]